MKKIVLTGGGTAGHVTPALALVPALKEEGFDIEYIGSKNGIEKELVAKASIPYHAVSTGKLRRYMSVKNITDMFRVVKGLGDSYRLLRRIKPDIIFSKGGFVGVPVTYAAQMLKIPVILHEGDYSLGLANRLSARYAKAVCVCFPETLSNVPKDKGVLTGMPIRGELLRGDKAKGKELCGFSDSGKPILLAMGGSTGAARINSALREALPVLLTTYDIIHICGKGNINKTYERKGYYQTDFAGKEMAHIYAAADIVVSRAGANSAAELFALAKPVLFIPLGAAQSRGDQILNARSFESEGFARVLPQESLTKDTFVNEIALVNNNKEKYISKMKAARRNDAIFAVISVIKRYTPK